MILRQPLRQRRRHQQQLLTVNRDEISCHPGSVLKPADDPDIPTASRQSGSDTRARRSMKAFAR
jgi:hypothetical protein